MYVISLRASYMTEFFWFIENSMLIHSVGCRLFNDKVLRVTKGGRRYFAPAFFQKLEKVP